MKTKILWAAAMLALISIVSCNNNEDQVQAVRLDKTKLEIVKGESVQLSAVVVPEQDAEFDPRKYLGPARDNMKKQYIHKIVNVLGSDGKAE